VTSCRSFEGVEVIGPDLHHLDALFQVLRLVIRRPHRVALGMR